eukprot:458319_1
MDESILCHECSPHSEGVTLQFRPLQENDFDQIKLLHEELFPVRYSAEFYDNVILNQTTTGKPLYSTIAALKHTIDEENADPNAVFLHQSQTYQRLARYVNIPTFKEQGVIEQLWVTDQFAKEALKECRVSGLNSDRIVGCIIGSFVEVTHMKITTVTRLVRSPAVHYRMFYIMTLGATGNFRRRGLGKKLIQDCIDMAEQVTCCGVIYLHVITYNLAAIRFYEKLGFYRMEEIKDYYKINGEMHSCYLYAYFINGNRRSLYDILYQACNNVVNKLKRALPLTTNHPCR